MVKKRIHEIQVIHQHFRDEIDNLYYRVRYGRYVRTTPNRIWLYRWFPCLVKKSYQARHREGTAITYAYGNNLKELESNLRKELLHKRKFS